MPSLTAYFGPPKFRQIGHRHHRYCGIFSSAAEIPRRPAHPQAREGRPPKRAVGARCAVRCGVTIGRILSRILILGVTLTLIVAHYVEFVRPAFLNWGATSSERLMALPGDEIVEDAAAQSTRAMTIDAPVADVWPWLAQLGQDRGGFYSFDLLENLVGCEMPTTDFLRPDKQHWQIGDKLWMYPPNKAGGAGFATLRTFVPERVLGFATRIVGTPLAAPENGSWTFVLQPLDARSTRLLVRGRGTARHALAAVGFDWLVFDPIHFAMERRMLLGIQELAETGVRSRRMNHVHLLLWTLTFAMFLWAVVLVVVRRRWWRPLAGLVASAAVFEMVTLLQPSPIVSIPYMIAAGLLVWHRSPRGNELGLGSLHRRVHSSPSVTAP